MKFHDSSYFVGKIICVYLKDDNNIIGYLESIEESGILINDMVETENKNREICNYFIPHHSISWIEYLPSGDY